MTGVYLKVTHTGKYFNLLSILSGGLCLLLFVLPSMASQKYFNAEADQTVLQTQPKYKPASIQPQGSQVAVLQGDPSKNCNFVIRLKFPKNSVIPLHWHPNTENVTVLKGSLAFVWGEKAKTATKDQAVTLGAGDFISFPPLTYMKAWVGKDGAEIQLHSVGPWKLVPVNDN